MYRLMAAVLEADLKNPTVQALMNEIELLEDSLIAVREFVVTDPRIPNEVTTDLLKILKASET